MRNPLAVLLVIQNLNGGGAERVFVNIANGLHKAGVKVDILLGRKEGVYMDLLPSGVAVNELGASSFAQYLRALPRVLRCARYSHVVVAGDIISAAVICTKKLLRGRFKVVVTHHYAAPKFRSVALLKEDVLLKSIHVLFTPLADAIVAVSAGAMAWLRHSSGHPLRQARVIYNPVFDDSIYEHGAAPLSFPRQVVGKKVLLSIGRLTTQKDQATLCRAFAHPEIRNNCVLFVLGVGPKETELKQLVRTLDLEHCVAFVGYDPNPYRWLSRCDLFVLSSINEGFGNVIVEAMAFGKTVVSTNCPSGPSEILAEGRFGYLCAPGNPQALAQAILEGLRAPMDSVSIQERSRAYHANNIIHSYLSLFEES